jgi:hypothetical protein
MDDATEKPREFCYHCGGEIAEGAPPRLFETNTPPAEPHPGTPCRCGEVIDDLGPKPRISGPINADHARNQDDPT